ncbi:MAG: T9SS type A sorting domain-containing protein [Cyclobacteriaceae bacterium]
MNRSLLLKNTPIFSSIENGASVQQVFPNKKQLYPNSRTKKASSETSLLDSVLIDLGDGQQWIENQKKTEYEYDLNGNIIAFIHYNKAASSDDWELDYREKDTYNNQNLLIEAVKEIWNSETKEWTKQLKIERTYDSQGNRTSNANLHWNNDASSWVGDNKLEQGFDEFGNQILDVQYVWNETLNDWEGQVKTDANFDSDSKLISYSYYRWDTNNSSWFNWFHFEYIYTGLVGEGLGQIWDDTLNDWVDFQKSDRAYNNDLLLISEVEYFFQNFLWKPLNKYEYTYDNKRNLILRIGYQVDSNGNWVQHNKFEQSYYGEDTDFSASYDWDKILNLWVGIFKYERLRDNDGNQFLFTTYEWNSSINTWKEVTKTESDYNEEGNLVVLTYYQLENEIWVNSSRRKYYYQQEEMITALEETHPTNPINEIILFPNPASHHVELKFDSQNIEWSILSLNGLVLNNGNMNLNEDPNNLIDISTLAPGMYLIEIHSGSSIERRKFIKE